MNKFECLKEKACRDGIDVIEIDFNSEKIKGLYCDGTIGINKKIPTSIEKTCILAEELGHHYTSYGDILDQSLTENRKQEYHARLWAYNNQIGLMGIVECYKHNCQNIHEMAEHLEVTEQFLQDTLEAYRLKYGICTTVDNYIIYFEPNLYVADMNFK